MKIIIYALFLLFPLTLAAAATFTADRHEGYGADCAACHGVEQPEAGAYVEMDMCLGCHGSYEELKEQTKKTGDYNPHANHLGEVDCTLCHRGHDQPASYCNTCHENLHTMN